MACLFSIAFGVAVMLSVANVDPSYLFTILVRELVGGVCLLAPAVAQRWRDGD